MIAYFAKGNRNYMFNTLKSDLQAVLKRDPAAKSIWEVMLCYPGFRAVRIHRRANWYYRHRMHLLARMTSEWCRFTTGIDIQSIVQGFGDGSSTTTTTERPVKGSAVSAPSATAASTDE